MKVRFNVMIISVFAILVIGCTSVNLQKPQAAPFETTEMKSMQSAQNWDLVAETLSNSINNKYRLLPPSKKRSIFVDAADTSIFSQSLKTLLVTHLVKKGIPITTNSDLALANCSSPAVTCNPLHLKLEKQVVPHKFIPNPFGNATLPKIASYVIYAVGDYWTSPAWAILPLSTYIEKNAPPVTNTEILVNALLTDHDDIVFTDTSIYYVNDNDKAIYEGGKLLNYIPSMQTNHLFSTSMDKAAIAVAALSPKCDNDDAGFKLTARLVGQGYRVETYEVQCKRSKITINCEEYNSCRAIN
ncbi:MAG: hypothetical protein D0530_01705 [Methylococcales bacterium]|nr:MAG: hypothetical protein D0530_01705 [Methylococcales bacterium]